MDKFNPTHQITIIRGGVQTQIPVMVEDGIAYTKQEWYNCASADWQIVDGELHFQGQVPVCDSYLIAKLPAK